MAKEIFEQPSVLSNAINYNLNSDSDQVAMPDLDLDFNKINNITMVACGTAF